MKIKNKLKDRPAATTVETDEEFIRLASAKVADLRNGSLWASLAQVFGYDVVPERIQDEAASWLERKNTMQS